MGVKIDNTPSKVKGASIMQVQMAEGDSQLIHENPVLEVPYTGKPMAEVEWMAGTTIPTEPYANVRFDCRIKMPCPVGMENEVMDYCQKWVDARLITAITDVKQTYGG